MTVLPVKLLGSEAPCLTVSLSSKLGFCTLCFDSLIFYHQIVICSNDSHGSYRLRATADEAGLAMHRGGHEDQHLANLGMSVLVSLPWLPVFGWQGMPAQLANMTP